MGVKVTLYRTCTGHSLAKKLQIASQIGDMKKILSLFGLSLALTVASCDVIKQLPMPGAPLTEGEAAQGIKEALSQGLDKAVGVLNLTDGFYKNELYKVLLPEEARKIENTLRDLGLGSMVDKAVLAINRGAEEAVGYAKPIFVNAIKDMTLTDAIGIVRGGDTSATHYFREKTTNQLHQAFYPVIQNSLNNVNATKYYDDLITRYNNFPTTIKKLNPDLASHVTNKATDALFNMIAKEEKNIRVNPLARTSEILKKVFGS